MFPDLIKIGNFTIHTYGVMVAIGLLVGYFIALYFAKREGLDKNKIEQLINETKEQFLTGDYRKNLWAS